MNAAAQPIIIGTKGALVILGTVVGIIFGAYKLGKAVENSNIRNQRW